MNKEMQEMVTSIDQKLEAHNSRIQGLASQIQSAKAFIQQSEPELLSLVGAIKELEEMKKNIQKITGEEKKPEEEEVKKTPDVKKY
jgi:peptidoglycan hydrolase CwlO-like protein